MNIEKALLIKGYMNPNELEWLAQNSQGKKNIVEIGTYYGRSARAIADNMPRDCKLLCIDPYPGIVFYEAGGIAISSGSYVYRQAQKNLADHISAGRVSFHRGTVKDSTLLDAILEFPPDFVFIDGDHCEEAVRADVKWAIENCKHGLISGHDYENIGWPCVKQVVDEHFPTIGREGFIWYAK